MGRTSSPGVEDPSTPGTFRSIRDRFLSKRNPNPNSNLDNLRDRAKTTTTITSSSSSDRFRSHRTHYNQRINRKGLFWFFPFRGKSLFYFALLFAVFLFAMASLVLQSSITSVFRQGNEKGRLLREGLKFGSTLRFVPSRRFVEGEGLFHLQSDSSSSSSSSRIGIRAPRIALVLGKMRKDAQPLLLFSVMKNLQKLGYVIKIHALESSDVHDMWRSMDSEISIFGGQVDWSIYEGVLIDSIEAKDVVSSLMQDPFCSVPLIWVIQEDTLAKRLPYYKEMGWNRLISLWKSAFSRADAIVFSDFSLPMLYSVLDTGNFFVIPGSPVDVWSAERYSGMHTKYQLREGNGYHEDDLVVLVIGSSFFFNELSWDYAVAMHTIGPLLMKYARRNDAGGAFKFIFLSGNSTDAYDDALQELASRLGLLPGSLQHFSMDGDVNGVLIMADIVLYGSSQEEQGFPPLLIRAMTFGISAIVPDIPIIRRYFVDTVHGVYFQKHNADALMEAFSLLVSDGKLSGFARDVATSGKLLAKNLLASECITTYEKLLEKVFHFPSDVFLPSPVSLLQQLTWEWNEINSENGLMQHVDPKYRFSEKDSIVNAIEEEFSDLVDLRSTTEDETVVSTEDIPTRQDWDVLNELEVIEESEMVETQELEERMEKDLGEWNDIYRDARKVEKLNFEANERDEGELERTGQPVCIYEIYGGAGAWPFLHHGSLYRGLSLSSRARRSRSDDVDAIGRLLVLNDTYYRDLLCEMGGMFSVANKVDNIHGRPWIGFQSWRAAGKKVSLSLRAEKVLEETLHDNTKGDVVYFWSRLDINGATGSDDVLTFWSMCDLSNGGSCRSAFGNAFRKMYALPPHVEALPPMPEDGGHWSTLHSWVMPTPSFLEFMMFTRMFVDSIDFLHQNSSAPDGCLIGSTELEKKHCYCRILELLVNIWAYHSARKMVYIDPHSGLLTEQHPVELRKGFMWVKYFNFTLLKSMDEDLAEAADDGDYPYEAWLWPLTGEVHWQGIYEREREERYRIKMDKKRKTREKLYDRMKRGYKQKSLGG